MILQKIPPKALGGRYWVILATFWHIWLQIAGKLHGYRLLFTYTYDPKIVFFHRVTRCWTCLCHSCYYSDETKRKSYVKSVRYSRPWQIITVRFSWSNCTVQSTLQHRVNMYILIIYDYISAIVSRRWVVRTNFQGIGPVPRILWSLFQQLICFPAIFPLVKLDYKI